jgi:hypothetical protein
MTQTSSSFLISRAAVAAYEANRAYCESIGDPVPAPWAELFDNQIEGYMKGVQFVLDNPDVTAADQHAAWMKQRVSEGWVYGAVKSDRYKTHPNLVEYEKLPHKQKVKDALFRAIVKGVCL